MSTNLPPTGPLAYEGQIVTPSIRRTTDPTTANTGFPVPTIWINTTSQKAWILVSIALGVAEWVPIGGNPGEVDSLTVDTFTAPGTNPVLPDSSENITITGGQVAAGTTANVIQTDSLAANTFTIQVQRSKTTATSTVGANGVSHLSSDDFVVDTNAFTTLAPKTAYSVLCAGTGTGQAIQPVATLGSSGQPLLSAGAGAIPAWGIAPVAGGGTGSATQAAYSVICGGTSTTGALQNVSGLGNAGQVLTSAGASALPTWAATTTSSGWTPTIYGSSSAGTVSYAAQTGQYTKIGRLVHLQGYLLFSSLTGTGDARIGGLPFAATSTYGYSTGSIVFETDGGWPYPTSCTYLGLQIVDSTQYLSIYGLGAGLHAGPLQCNSGTGCYLRFAIDYMTD